MDENSHVPCCFIYQQSAIGTAILRAGSVLPYLVQVRRQDRGGCKPLFSFVDLSNLIKKNSQNFK
nr:MAG TPA: hypothetical protein [Caudoviricetes sp.]